MEPQSKKFFIKHGDNEYTYYGSHMSMHMGSGSILVYNDQGYVVGAHKEWDCAYEITKPDLTKSEFSGDLGRNPYRLAGLTGSDAYKQMQRDRNHFASSMLDSIVKGERIMNKHTYRRYMVFQWSNYDNVGPFSCIVGDYDFSEDAVIFAKSFHNENTNNVAVFDRIEGVITFEAEELEESDIMCEPDIEVDTDTRPERPTQYYRDNY